MKTAITTTAITTIASLIFLTACGNETDSSTAQDETTETTASTSAPVETPAEETTVAESPVAETMADEPAAPGITEADVIAVQQEWGEGIVAISSVHASDGDYEARATEHINTLYAYGMTDVMFKPTLAAEDQFRETFDEALSYFIGREGTEDGGFAISGWTNVRWENNGIYTDDDSAMAMGNYYFTGPDGSETKVEYSFGYVLDDAGNLRINLHHSSLPYSAAE